MTVTANWQRGGTDIDDDGSQIRVIDAANLDYRVEQVPLLTDDNARMSVRGRVANVRVDADGERHILGCVSSKYKIVHNVEALDSFSCLVRYAGARFTRAGTIDNGRIAYVFADLPEQVDVLPGDPVRRSLMFTNSFDGSTPLGFTISPVRLWCSNQLVMARRKGFGFSIRHNTNAFDRTREAVGLLGKATRAYDLVIERMRAMANTSLGADQLKDYFNRVRPVPDQEDQRPHVQSQHDRWTQRFENGIGNSGSRTRTLYHALNAVTEDVDHRELSRRVKDPFFYTTFGGGGLLKQRAWAVAEQIIGVTLN